MWAVVGNRDGYENTPKYGQHQGNRWFSLVPVKHGNKTLSFNPKCGQHQGNMDAFESMLLHEGMWTSCREAFKLDACVNL
jgi:hypothetical protein